MSGLRCIVIATGNRSQAFSRDVINNFPWNPVVVAAANYSIGAATSLCQLSGYYDDGEEAMTDAQALEATQLMGAFNNELSPFATSTQKHDAQAITDACNSFNSKADDLIARVESNS